MMVLDKIPIKYDYAGNKEPEIQSADIIRDLSEMVPSDSESSIQNNHNQPELSEISYSKNLSLQNKNQIRINFETQKLRSLLKSWNQEVLLDHFIAQNIFLNVLKVIKRHHIERLLKNYDMGTQILFEHNLEEWRHSIGMPLMTYSDAMQCQTSFKLSHSSSPSSSCSSMSTLTPPSHELRSQEVRFTPYTRSSNPDDNNIITLANILNETPKGAMLSEYYNKFSKFQDDQRYSLINTIAQFFEEKGVHMTLATSYRLEHEILERFPNEKLGYYRTGKRGKIYNKFCNLKTSFKTAVSNHVLPQTQKKGTQNKKSRHEKIFVPEDDAESSLRALRHDNLTAEQFDNCWKACSQYRLEQIKMLENTAAILENWPFYKTLSGFRLIDMDFQTAFENGNSLLDKWQLYFEKILQFLTNDSHVKEKNIRTILENVKNDDDLLENSRNAALFWALHGYFVPINKVVKKDATSGKKNTIKFTIKDSQESFMFMGKCHQEIEDRILHLKKKGESIQPFIYCVGRDILTINEIYVYFDDIRFKFSNFLRAVDICFKIIYLFDLDFPVASVMFYNFIETYFFKFNSQHSFSKVHILSEALDSTANI